MNGPIWRHEDGFIAANGAIELGDKTAQIFHKLYFECVRCRHVKLFLLLVS